jgi:uncharacterized protein YbjT (DUF2867 family)
MTDATYLVLLGTSRQGRATIQALKEKGVKNIVATSRNPNGASAQKLLEKGVAKVLPVDLQDPPSVVKAIQESQASRLWFATDWYAIKKPTREKEFMTGKVVIDAVKETGGQIKHVVFSSVCNANSVPEEVQHFWSKADVEDYLKKELPSLNVSFSILRPVAFFDNYDDPGNYNPLVKGYVKGLFKPDVKVQYISTVDIGKGGAALLMDPKQFSGQTIDAAGGKHNGLELADALTEVSGIKCAYKVAFIRWLLWLFMPDLYHMTIWTESDGYTADVDAFKKIVPDAMDAKAWFKYKGQWNNGEKFQAAD